MVRDSIDRARDDMRGWRDCSDEWANSRSFLGIDFQIGGVIGPLPDEITTIEVSPIQWRTIYETIGWQDRFADWEPEFDDHDQALAAFNAH